MSQPADPGQIQALTPRRLEAPLLRPEEAAELLSVKTSWVYEAVRTGKLSLPTRRQTYPIHPPDARRLVAQRLAGVNRAEQSEGSFPGSNR
jgi:hypothetical protein